MIMIQYAIIETDWGYFGLAGRDGALMATCLPVETPEIAQSVLLRSLNLTSDRLPLAPGLLPDVQEKILAYFDGENIDFSAEIALDLSKMSSFGKIVLAACARIGFGRTTTYGRLAQTIGYPGAARAVGTALGRNPIPLIVPCHRVLRADGGLGGFSAIGSTTLKQRLLDHEQAKVPQLR
jgi:methylated-DNA-[protein]-cysteine S-methyltransferase